MQLMPRWDSWEEMLDWAVGLHWCRWSNSRIQIWTQSPEDAWQWQFAGGSGTKPGIGPKQSPLPALGSALAGWSGSDTWGPPAVSPLANPWSTPELGLWVSATFLFFLAIPFLQATPGYDENG